MASQRRVKEYLEKHKISPLFEDLMAKLIQSMPGDPLNYLVSVLERKIEKKKQMTGDGLRKSTGAIQTKPITDSISAWAVSSAGDVAVAKDRSYDKPWTTNTTRLSRPSDTKQRSAMRTDASPTRPRSAKSERSPVRKSTSLKVAWNNDKKTPTADFDELWQMKQDEQKVPLGRQQSRSPPIGRRQKTQPAFKDLDLTFTSHSYTGPRRSREVDPLHDEFSVPKNSLNKTVDQSEQERSVLRFGKRKQRLSNNKQELSQLLAAERSKTDSGIDEEVDHDDQEDGTEVYEDEAELKREGVRNVKPSGIRVKTTCGADRAPLVRVSICGRCARVMSAGSEPIRTGTVTDSPTYDIQSSAQFTQNIDDEEFESVSQVSGPRKPVWVEEEKATPRKGTSMLEHSGYPHKGLPMYSRGADVAVPGVSTDTVLASVHPERGSSVASGKHSLHTATTATPALVGHTATPALFDGRDGSSVDIFAGEARVWSPPADSDVTDLHWASERARRAQAHKQVQGHGRY